jgi:hypothetical protein
MIDSSILVQNCSIDSAVVHHIGYKPTDDGISFSKSTLNINGDTHQSLLTWFLSSFRFDEYFNLFHE